MKEGYLGWNYKEKRYGMLDRDLWVIAGFHCGDCFEVFINGEWKPTRIELARPEQTYYLIDTDLAGEELEHRRIRINDEK